MERRVIISAILFSLVLTLSCVDRLIYDLPLPGHFGISISGNITDRPGPYRVEITRSFDINSRDSLRVPFSAREVKLFEVGGVEEQLVEARTGVYETHVNGIRGIAGRSYVLEVTLNDGRKYRSLPDTLNMAGEVEDVYYEFNGEGNSPNIYTKSPYGFDIFADASSGNYANNLFMWVTETVFRSDTTPEKAKGSCNPNDFGICNFAPLCSGMLNIGTNLAPNLVRVAPCTCCTCWYRIYNSAVKLTSKLGLSKERVYFKKESVFRLPLGPWIFQYKAYVIVKLKSLSKQTERFWHAVQDQQMAVGSLFQPVTGRIPNMFEQLEGPPMPALGIFYASGESSFRIEIRPDDIPDKSVLPTRSLSAADLPCTDFYPNGSTTKPDYWRD